MAAVCRCVCRRAALDMPSWTTGQATAACSTCFGLFSATRVKVTVLNIQQSYYLKHLVEDVLHGAVWCGGAGGDADGQRPLRQPAVGRRQLPPALHRPSTGLQVSHTQAGCTVRLDSRPN
jgi:hypothetical protein